MKLICLFLFLFQLGFPICQNLNSLILSEAYFIEGGGYVWDGTGVPVDLHIDEKVFIKKSDTGSFCSGFTLFTVFNALKKSHKLAPSVQNDFYAFYRSWYGIPPESKETQCLHTLKKYRIGHAVSINEALPGDIVQFWRNNKTGHSVVFLSWDLDAFGRISGMNYRSSQKSTFGIGDRCEDIGSGKEDINIQRIYIGRLDN